MTALSASAFCRYGIAARAAAPRRPKAASDSTASEISVRRRIWLSYSMAGLPQTCTVASVPKLNQLFFFMGLYAQRNKQSLASCREIRAKHLYIDWPAAVFRKVASLELRLDQPIELGERHVDRHADRNSAVLHRGHQLNRAGKGQFGLVSFGRMRVSACTPMAIVRLRPSICGCAAMARTGRISSHSGGSPVLSPPSGIERHILDHCPRAVRSIVSSLRSRACRVAI